MKSNTLSRKVNINYCIAEQSFDAQQYVILSQRMVINRKRGLKNLSIQIFKHSDQYLTIFPNIARAFSQVGVLLKNTSNLSVKLLSW